MSIQHERSLAIREGEEIAAEDDYFDARPGVLKSREARKIFLDAFNRGWDRSYASQQREAARAMVTK